MLIVQCLKHKRQLRTQEMYVNLNPDLPENTVNCDEDWEQGLNINIKCFPLKASGACFVFKSHIDSNIEFIISFS